MLLTHEDRALFIKMLSARIAGWQRVFEEYAEEVCRSELIKELYLVGSRARGDNVASSDFDVVAIVDRGADVLEIAERLRLLRKKGFPLDLLVLYEDEARDPLYEEMLRDKKKIC